MQSTDAVFEAAMSFVLPHEGGLVNDPADTGGLTNHGVTQHEYDGWRRRHGNTLRSVALIRDDEVSAIYRDDYADPIGFDELVRGYPSLPKLAICLLDWAINHGVSGAVKDLQTIVGATPDGVIGPHTLEAIRTWVRARSEWALIEVFDAMRRAWYEDDVERNGFHRRFLTGWEKRVTDLDQFLKGLWV
jgi:lysozyme family protein